MASRSVLGCQRRRPCLLLVGLALAILCSIPHAEAGPDMLIQATQSEALELVPEFKGCIESCRDNPPEEVNTNQRLLGWDGGEQRGYVAGTCLNQCKISLTQNPADRDAFAYWAVNPIKHATLIRLVAASWVDGDPEKTKRLERYIDRLKRAGKLDMSGVFEGDTD